MRIYCDRDFNFNNEFFKQRSIFPSQECRRERFDVTLSDRSGDVILTTAMLLTIELNAKGAKALFI